MLIENEEIINESAKVANVINFYSESVTESLNLLNWVPEPYDQAKDWVERIVQRFSHHPSIIKIKGNIKILKKISFTPGTLETVKKFIYIYGLPQSKSVSGDIPLKVLKSSEFTFSYLTEYINEVLWNSKYPESLKLFDTVPVFKKKHLTDKSNFRPISIFPLPSKVFEKVIFAQLCNYMNKFLNSLLCGFRKAHSTQHAFLRLLQAWQKELDQCGFVGPILMDLSKAYDDCLPHDLLIAKLEAYGLDTVSRSLLKNYLANCKQRTKVWPSYSDWFEFLRGIPQGSILGPLLFNIFINDIFFEIQKSNICNFADDNTLYFCSQDLQTVIENLTYDVKNVLTWFKINSMKANPEKSQFMILSKIRPPEYNLLIDSN